MNRNLKNLMKYLDIILGTIFISYFICLIFVSKLSFKYIFLFLGIGFIGYHFIKDNLKRKEKYYKPLRSIFIIFMCIFIVIESGIIFYPKKNKENSDYVIVLGALVNKNTPSKTLQDRLDTTLDYINQNDDVYIVVSGGKGRGENISEAKAMDKYLRENHVDSKRILKEDKSTTTQENFLYSKELIEKHSKEKIDNLKIKIITTDFHSLRSSIMAKKCGFTNFSFYTSSTRYYLAPLNYFREFFGIIYYVFVH